MTKEKIERINALAHKSKTPEGLTPAERAEQLALREEYLAQFRASFAAQLEHTVIEYPDGTREHLKRKNVGAPHGPADVRKPNGTSDTPSAPNTNDASNASETNGTNDTSATSGATDTKDLSGADSAKKD